MSRPWRRARIALLLVASVLVATACSGDDEPTRDAAGVVTGAGTMSVFDLGAGDCLDPPADLSGDIATIKVVPCADSHTQEVFAKAEATGSAYPGAELLATEANKQCVTKLQSPPLSLSPDDGYYWSYLLPSFNGWTKDNDRTIVCVFVFPTSGAGSSSGAVTGSVVAQVEAGTVQPGSPPPVSAVLPTLADGG